MSLLYDKDEVKSKIGPDEIYNLLMEWGGEPSYAPWGILSSTICHNPPGEGSRKLYYYYNSGLFRCYTGCDEPNMDIYGLLIKVARIQWGKEYNLNDAVRYIAIKFGIAGEFQIEDDSLIDWKTFDNYDRLEKIEIKDYHIVLKEYDNNVLKHLNYHVKIKPWLDEGISQEALDNAKIGYFPASAQITIPHYDINERFIGLRGRTLSKEDAELYGKYRPMVINGIQYNHPLGMNLYNLNKSKKNIKTIGKTIIFEGEKSCLKYQSFFGAEHDISVACCGSNISAYQIEFLKECGAKEIIIALDRQFQVLGDTEFKRLTNNLTKLNDRYKNEVDLTFMFDKNMITGYKSSPIDEGEEKFLKLLNERIKL